MSEHPKASAAPDGPRSPQAPEARLIDLRHLGRERVIGSWLLGDVLVDPGPASCLPALLEGLGDQVPRALALTHIHLDHAGAAGTLAHRFPELEIWVHERGAPHLADPSRLIASASRLYGADMAQSERGGDQSACGRVSGDQDRIGLAQAARAPDEALHHRQVPERFAGCDL